MTTIAPRIPTSIENLRDQLASLTVPRTGSPVPWLTSLHARPGRGRYGNAAFPGNCSGLLIHDLLSYYRPKFVLDPMTGSGTCRDVCRELQIHCQSFDLSSGFDATDRASFESLYFYDFIWLHPPYWRLIRYGNHPRCLSNAATLPEFISGLKAVIRNCLSMLAPEGRLAILMGDMKYQGRYCALPFRTFNAAVGEGLWLDAPEIIRASHGASSSKKTYRTVFIPRLHDICMVFRQRDE